MTRSTLNFAATIFAAILPLAAAATANAQSRQQLGEVNVPFAFEIGGTHLQPGTYRITFDSQHIMIVRGAAKSQTAIGMARWEIDDKASNSTKVVFHHCGDKYFLREVWDTNESRHVATYQTPAETKLRKTPALNVAANTSIAPAVEVVLAASLY